MTKLKKSITFVGNHLEMKQWFLELFDEFSQVSRDISCVGYDDSCGYNINNLCYINWTLLNLASESTAFLEIFCSIKLLSW